MLSLHVIRFLSSFVAFSHAASFASIGIPTSNATVSISRFNVNNLTLVDLLHTLVAPILPGRDTLLVPMYSFLIEHHSSSKRVLFDLGMRKDPLNLAPSLVALFEAGKFSPSVFDRDVVDLLDEAGIPLDSIESVIWSHAHLDHIGDMSRFPNSTSLVIGAATNTSTFPTDPNAGLQDSDFAGRTVTKMDFSKSKLSINDLKAIDYFGDGSFYLIDTPGHTAGHLTGLARVTANPATFILLAGDTFHHPGEARPRPAFQKAFPCPAHLLASADDHISTDFFFSPGSHNGEFDLRSRAESLLRVSDSADSFNQDPAVAAVSLEKVARWDADENIFVLISHDMTVVESLPDHPHLLNGWKKAGWKAETVWDFVDFEGPSWIFSPA